MENNNLQYDLIVDTDLAVQNAYGVWQEKTNYGKTYMGTVRSTFVIERMGVIRCQLQRSCDWACGAPVKRARNSYVQGRVRCDP